MNRIHSSVFRKSLVFLLTLALLGGLAVGFDGGDGSSGNPYEISTCGQLQDMRGDIDANYELVSDIDCSATSNWNSGNGFKPVGNGSSPFSGVLNGNGNEVRNLNINRGSKSNVGLFGFIINGKVENIDVVNVNIKGLENVGGLVGYNRGGLVSSSYSAGRVSGSRRLGGLVGLLDTSSISSSYSAADVSASGNYVGGLVGLNSGGQVSSSYSVGDVSGTANVGGLVGLLDGGGVSSSYSVGDVSASSNGGGLIGFVGSGSVGDSYWDTESSGQSSSAGGIGLTTSEMTGSTAESDMNFFDFTNTWSTVLSSDYDTDSDSYPILRERERENQLVALNVFSNILTSPGSDSVTGGNTSKNNLEADRATTDWAGFYGTLDQTVSLSDGSTFYQWTAGEVTGAAILAAPTGNSFSGDEGNLAAPNDVSQLNHVPTSGTEKVSNTYNEGIGQPADLSAEATNSTTVNYGDADDFKNYLFKSTADNGNNPIFAAEAKDSATGFDGSTVDYQLLVGSEGSEDDSVSFNFYAKIQ